jgi:high-affinity Fe2+/Pb2+ permease
MSNTYRYLILYFLPVALIAGFFLAFLHIQIAWYIFVLVIPILLFVAFVIVGYCGRLYHDAIDLEHHAKQKISSGDRINKYPGE